MPRNRTNTSSIYRPRKDPGHHVDGDLGLCAPIYRGFRLACTGGEIERLKRAVDEYRSRRYVEADSPSARVNVLVEERQQRDAPKDWK